MDILDSPYYEYVVSSTAVPTPRNIQAQQRHIKHLIGHLLYVKKRMDIIETYRSGQKSWRPLRVLNELRSAVMYLDMIQKDIDFLQVETHHTPYSMTELHRMLGVLKSLLQRLFPYALEKESDDIYLVLPKERIGPLCSVYLAGIFADSWNELLDLATAWGVSTDTMY